MAPHTKGQKAREWPARGQRAGTKRASLGARGRRAALGTGSPTLGAGPGAARSPRPAPRAPPSRRGPEGASRASVSAGDARRAELRPEDATRAQFRRGGRASDSDGGGVGAPSCGEAAGAPDGEPGPEEGERVGSGGRGGRWARRGPVTVAGPGAAPSRPPGAAGLGPGARPAALAAGRRGVRVHWPRPRRWDPARRASVARGLPAPGARAWAPAGSRRAGARSVRAPRADLAPGASLGVWGQLFPVGRARLELTPALSASPCEVFLIS